MEEEKQLYTIILRHDTSTMWLSNDPILALGEYGVEDDTHKVKRGDGEHKWSELYYEDFGLTYIVTFANLSGEISDNKALADMFGEKLSLNVFEDVGYVTVTNIEMKANKKDDIAKISRTVKNISSGATISTNTILKSEDNTIQGYWSADEDGNDVLNLISVCSIADYQPQRKYFRNQLCYYQNKLYRAYDTIDSAKTFDENQWVLLSSMHSIDILYDNLRSGMAAENVKDALDELKRLDDKKLPKSTEPDSVYGTTDLGEQIMIPKDDLRKVDTVNRKKADLNKNIQLDAGEINYSDAHPEYGSVRKVLDEKVDKNFAGENAKIVRDVEFNYNEETGKIELVEDKVSPKNGESARETRSIDVVSERELADKAQEINDRIDTEVSTLNGRIDTEVSTLNTTIETNKTEINEKVDTIKEETDQTIADNKTEINDRVTEEVETLNTRMTEEVATLNATITEKKADSDTQIATLNTKVDTIKTETDQTIADNKADIEAKLQTAKEELKHNIDINDGEINGRVTREVETLNGRIDTEVDTLNTRVDTEVGTLNDRIDNEVETLNNTVNEKEAGLKQNIDDNKTDIEQKLAEGLNTKIDKDISTNILIDLVASQQSQEPTMKMIRANTETKERVVSHLHFKAIGDIETKFVDADHIAIDSTVVDEKIANNARRLDNAETRLTAHDSNIASLEEHDVNHDRMLATHTEQIANHETRMLNLEERANGFDVSIADLDAKIEQEITNRNVADAQLETDISRNALNIENNTQAIRDNADNIIELNNLLQENVTNLTQSKVDKTFAQATSNMVVGNIDYSEPNGNELLKINKTLVSPEDGSHNVSGFKLFSTNNTLTAAPVIENDELIGIDLSTNLDTDVNYYVTTETLSTTIPSYTTIPISSLTPTDKAQPEIYDIVSDSEGTWARVQEIDTENNTVTVVTFHKHAQAIWGTIKGNIDDQQDLKNKFDTKLNKIDVFDRLSCANSNKDDGVNNKNGASIMLNLVYKSGDGRSTTKSVVFVGNGDRKSKTTAENANILFQLVDNDDNPIDTYSSTSSNLHKILVTVQPENVVFDKQDTTLTSVKLSPAIRELSNKLDTNKTNLETLVNTTKTELNTKIEAETTNRENADTALQTNINNVNSAKVDKVTEANKVYGTDGSGNQTTYNKEDFGKVDTVNGIIADVNKNIELTANDIKVNDTEQTIYQYLTDMFANVSDIVNDLAKQIVAYTSDTIYKHIGAYSTSRFVTFEREDGILLMAKIMKDFTSSSTGVTEYDNFMNDVEAGNLKLVGIPEQTGGGDTPPTPVVPTTGDVADNVIDKSGVVMAASHTSAGGPTGTKYIDIVNNSETDKAVTTETWDMPNNIIGVGETVTATNNDNTLNATEIDEAYIDSNMTIQEAGDYGAEVMQILNQVDGNEATYDGLGGTEDEISTTLDEILGNN